MIGWTDSHCHLHDLEGIAGFLEHARAANVERLICVGTTKDSSLAAVHLAQSCLPTDISEVAVPLLYATIGQHPHDAAAGVDWIEPMLERAGIDSASDRAPAGSIVAIGECGLDYHYHYSAPEEQRAAFVKQIAIARKHDLALVIHTREAWSETFSILEQEERPDRIVIHCFTGGPQEARRCLEIGAFLSFSGIATFKNAEEIRAAADLCPLDRLLVETDAPYLTPVPHRGSPNEPAYVSLVGEALAARRGIGIEDFARTTSENAIRAFGLAP